MIFNVQNFGAKGDGITDDTAAIQSAIDAAAAAGGGQVYMPTGTYIVSGRGTFRWLPDAQEQCLPVRRRHGRDHGQAGRWLRHQDHRHHPLGLRRGNPRLRRQQPHHRRQPRQHHRQGRRLVQRLHSRRRRLRLQRHPRQRRDQGLLRVRFRPPRANRQHGHQEQRVPRQRPGRFCRRLPQRQHLRKQRRLRQRPPRFQRRHQHPRFHHDQ